MLAQPRSQGSCRDRVPKGQAFKSPGDGLAGRAADCRRDLGPALSGRAFLASVGLARKGSSGGGVNVPEAMLMLSCWIRFMVVSPRSIVVRSRTETPREAKGLQDFRTICPAALAA